MDLLKQCEIWHENDEYQKIIDALEAVPAAMTHDELEFIVPAPIPKERAMELAVEQYGFCPDQDQGEEGNIGTLADTLWQSTVWYFWWD